VRPGGVGAGLVAVCLWGLAPVATRSLVSELAPLPLLTLRQLLAAGVLLPWAVPALRRIDARDLPRLIAAGLLGMVGYNLPVTVGLQWLPASSAGLLLATEPVWVLVIGLVFLAERAGLRIVLGTGVALAGVAVIAGPAALSPGSGTRAAAGAALVLLATLAFGGYTVVLCPLSEKYGPVSATAASSVAGALPYLALVGTIWPPRLSRRQRERGVTLAHRDRVRQRGAGGPGQRRGHVANGNLDELGVRPGHDVGGAAGHHRQVRPIAAEDQAEDEQHDRAADAHRRAAEAAPAAAATIFDICP